MLLVTPENRGAHYTCAEPHSSPFYNTLIRFFSPDSSTIHAESEICCMGDIKCGIRDYIVQNII